MKTEIKVLDFLKTGRFGTVEMNDSMETVIHKLGKPDGDHNYDVVKPRKGIYYSMYEFMFLDDKLESIQNDHFDIINPELMEFENDTIKINSGFLKADRIKKMKEIESQLKLLHIEYDIVDYWGRKAIKTSGNVIIDFNDQQWSDDEDDFVKINNIEDYELIGIRYHPHLD